jgi:pre-60S factor REI1
MLGTNVPSPFCSYDDADHMQIVTAGGAEPGIALSETGTELIITGASGEPGSSKVIGSREFARYYKQRHRPNENREVVLVNQVIGR